MPQTLSFPAPEPHDPADTADLMGAIAQGDRAAFSALYRSWFHRVRWAVLRVLRDPAQTDEVVQEVFLEVWSHPERFRPEKGSAAGFLLRLARSRAIDRVRASQTYRDYTHIAGTEHEADGQPPSDVFEMWAAHHDLRRSLETLTFLQREIVDLVYYQELTQKEVGARLGVPLGTVKSRVSSALIALRRHHESNEAAPAQSIRAR